MAAACEMRESEAAQEEEKRRDWGSGLPSLVVASVAERLTIIEFLRMSLVCKPWSSVLTHQRRRRRRQQQQPTVPVLPRRLEFPWLMVPAEHTSVRTPTRTFFSLPDGRSYHLTDPVLSGKHVIASDKGWLILSDQQWVLSLLQPITGDHILLPSLFTIHELVVDFQDPSSGAIVEFSVRYPETGCIAGPFTLEERHHGVISKVALSSSPSDGHDFVVVVLLEQLFMYFARPGDSAWTGVDKVTDKIYCFIPDILFVDRHNLIGLTGGLDVINVDFREKIPRYTILERTNGSRGHVFCYLASCAGDLFVVSRLKKEDPDTQTQKNITDCASLYELVHGDDGERCWVETNDLKGHALFLGTNNCICLMAKDVAGLKENCIYFTDDDTDYITGEDGKQSARDMVVWDLEEETC